MMAVGYLILILYFRAIGGYKAEVLVGHAAEDEKFTGGTEGPGEGCKRNRHRLSADAIRGRAAPLTPSAGHRIRYNPLLGDVW